MARAGELHAGHLGQIGHALDEGQAGAALHAGGEALGQQLHAAVRGDAGGVEQRGLAQCVAAQQQHSFFAFGTGLRDGLGDGLHGHVVGRLRRGRGRRRAGLAAFAPGHVGRQDERGHLAGQAARGGEGIDRVLAQGGGASGGVHEAGRDVAGHGFDVALQLGVVLDVVGGVVAHDGEHRHLALARVVQVGQAIAQAAAQVQQHGGGFAGHAGVAVGRAGGHALEQGEHGAHARLEVERGDEVHLAGAGVGEAHLDTGVGQGLHQCLGAVHDDCSLFDSC